MVGLILCGGQSSRMGSDKGLLMANGKTWAEAAMHKLQSINIPVHISVNPHQLSSYSKIFPGESLICDNEEIFVKGPLQGILSTHRLYPNEDMFVLACDMLQMKNIMLENLLEQYNQQKAAAYVYSVNDNIEPLCGIYTADGLQYILSMYDKNMLPKNSMKFILEQLSVNYTHLPEDDTASFHNYNEPGDLPV